MGAVGRRGVDDVRRTAQRLDRHAGVDVDAHRDVVAAALVGRQVVHLGRLAGAAVLSGGHRADAIGGARRVEARTDHHRKHELVVAVVVGERVVVRDVDVDLLARLDVGDRLGEDVGPLLGEERSDVALLARLDVELLGLLALADDAANVAVADRHDELAHRRVLRQREDIERLDLLAVRILVPLLHLHAGDVASDAGAHVGVLERQWDLVVVALGLEPAVDRLRGRRLIAVPVGARDHPQLLAGGEARQGGGPGRCIRGTTILGTARPLLQCSYRGRWGLRPGVRLRVIQAAAVLVVGAKLTEAILYSWGCVRTARPPGRRHSHCRPIQALVLVVQCRPSGDLGRGIARRGGGCPLAPARAAGVQAGDGSQEASEDDQRDQAAGHARSPCSGSRWAVAGIGVPSAFAAACSVT